MITEYIKKILSRIPDWIITSVAAIVPGLFTRYGPWWAMFAFIASFAIAIYILHLQQSEHINLESGYSTKTQFEVFDLLNKWQKRRIKSYFCFYKWSIIFIPIWLSAIILFDRIKIINIVNTEWYIIPFFLSIYIIYSSFFVWKAYTHSINYYDSDIPQIFWNYIEELIEQLDCKEGELNNVLNEEGKKQLLIVLEKRKEGKIPTNLSERVFKDVLEAEFTIIEKLNSKKDSDIKEVHNIVKSIIKQIESHNTSSYAWLLRVKPLLLQIKKHLVKTKK